MATISWRYKGSCDSFVSQDPLSGNQDCAFIEAVLFQSKLTCSDCGFQSRPSKQVKSGFMQIRPRNADYDSREVSNWTVVCPFCHAYYRMTAALDSEKYRIIAAPWISQSELSNIVRPLLVILSDIEHLYYTEALQIYKTLLSSESAVAALLPHIPATEATPADNLKRYFNLFDSVLTDQQYLDRHIFASSLRMIPDKAHFSVESNYWNAAIYNQYPLSKWERLVSWKLEQKSE